MTRRRRASTRPRQDRGYRYLGSLYETAFTLSGRLDLTPFGGPAFLVEGVRNANGVYLHGKTGAPTWRLYGPGDTPAGVLWHKFRSDGLEFMSGQLTCSAGQFTVTLFQGPDNPLVWVLKGRPERNLQADQTAHPF